jgi:carbonic anhydrase
MLDAGKITLTSDEARQRLVSGNERFVASKPIHPRQSPDHRAALLEGQRPFAAILACSDSRVPPEVGFDQGLGDLFVVRVAGQVPDDSVLGSIDFAVEHLGVPLIVVLGHSKCGMIKACAHRLEVKGNLMKMAWKVQSAVDRSREQPGEVVDNAAKTNALMIAESLETTGSILPDLVKKDALKVMPAFYDLDTGVVEWLA